MIDLCSNPDDLGPVATLVVYVLAACSSALIAGIAIGRRSRE